MFFCLNEEDEDDLLQPVCGEDFINFLESLDTDGIIFLEPVFIWFLILGRMMIVDLTEIDPCYFRWRYI